MHCIFAQLLFAKLDVSKAKAKEEPSFMLHNFTLHCFIIRKDRIINVAL